MAIEVKQLLIKSTVLHSGHPEHMDGNAASEVSLDTETLKQEVIADCRALLLEMFRQQQER